MVPEDKRRVITNIKGRVRPGKWYYYIGIAPDYQMLIGEKFHFEVFKMKRLPPEAVEMTRGRHYDGIIFRARVDRWR